MIHTHTNRRFMFPTLDDFNMLPESDVSPNCGLNMSKQTADANDHEATNP